MLSFQFKRNHHFFFLFAIFFLIIFYLHYYLFSGNPNFICNDSFQYLSIAKEIYQKKQLYNITNFALDLYYDELAMFNYDFTNIKPYHFPSYPIFLSFFYYIYDNDNFVIYASQYLSFLLYSCFIFLILKNYLNSKKTVFLLILLFFTNAFNLYISDSGKEIICSSLFTMVIYLALYSPNKNRIYIKLITSLALVFLTLTRNYHLVFAFFLVIYYCLPSSLKDSVEDYKLSQKITYTILIFLVPLFFYVYFYYFQNYHLFIFDNRTDIYGGRTISDAVYRIFVNGILAFLTYLASIFEIINNQSFPLNFSIIFNLFQTQAFSVVGIVFFYLNYLKNFRKNPKITKLFIINLFFLALFLAVTVRFSYMGFRMMLAYIPFVYLYFYQSFFEKNQSDFKNKFIKYMLVFFLIFNFISFIIITRDFKIINKETYKLNLYTLDFVKRFKPKFIVVDSHFYLPHSMPIFYLFPKETYFFNFWRDKNLCNDIENYQNHNINFDMLIIKKHLNEFDCNFLNDNFQLIDFSQYGYIYINKSKIIK